MGFFDKVVDIGKAVLPAVLPTAYIANAAYVGAIKSRAKGGSAVSGAMQSYAPITSALGGKAGTDLPPIVDPAIDQAKLADNASAYRAARRRQLMAGNAGSASTLLTGPSGLGDSSGGTAKTLLGA